MLARETLNRGLDRLVRPTVHLRRRALPTFQVCGYTGLALAIVLAMTLVIHRGLSPWVMAAVVLAAVGTFFALAFATKTVVGEEVLVYYHHEIAVLSAAALLLWVLRQPVFAYLDATLLGVGLFLVCGRIGCLMVGCCHGRPHRWGVCYQDEHAQAGFTPYYVGVRLFPIQLVESLWVLAVVIVGSALVWRGAAPGVAFAWYIIAYDVGRFLFEFVRGDAGRPYRFGFSEAQWISLALTWLVVLGGALGLLPTQGWHLAAAAGLTLGMIAVAWQRRGTMGHRLLAPQHVREVAEGLQSPNNEVVLTRTSLGIQISRGVIPSEGATTYHYAFSAPAGELTTEAVRALAGLLLQLQPQANGSELVRSERGIYHLLLRRRG